MVITTRKTYFKTECPQIDFLMLVYWKIGRKNIKTIYLEKKKKEKLSNHVNPRKREILRKRNRNYKKNLNFLKILNIDRKLRKKFS